MGEEAGWARPPLLKIRPIGRLVCIILVDATFLVCKDVGLVFAYRRDMGSSARTFRVADTGVKRKI